MAERNMDMKKCPMPVQDPDVRNKNFEEVALGYTYEMAVNEARRCLNCPKKPCQSACPVQIDIPAFIERVANEDMEGAFEQSPQIGGIIEALIRKLRQGELFGVVAVDILHQPRHDRGEEVIRLTLTQAAEYP